MSKEIILPQPQNLGAAKINFKQAMDPAQIVAINAEIAAIQAANAIMVTTGKVHGAWNTIGYNGQRWNGSDLMVPPAVPPANEVTFQLYVDGEVKSSRTVSDNKIFTLPSGYKSDNIAVRVQSQCLIKSIEIGATPEALRQA
jgi:DMSO/TMAO reductase YedYZ molybdopterin-dependent catalytic subunit